MISYPDISSQVEPEAAPVVYEQPLNERMRTFLRLEFLYTQATYHSESPSPWSSRAAVSSLLEILAITARGDSRSDVLKELERQVNVLKEYQSKTGVDTARLKSHLSPAAPVTSSCGIILIGSPVRPTYAPPNSTVGWN